MKVLPTFIFEEPLWSKGFTVIGIDEVGRGAFAGPVGIGGVVFDPEMSVSKKKKLLSLGINDSKKLTPAKRKSFAKIIKEVAIAYDVVFIDVPVINKIGIGKATFLGMQQVAQHLSEKTRKHYLLIDAFTIPGVTLPQEGIIRGDSLSISIAAASILAKVERDILMEQLSQQCDKYAWEKNKGYGTLTHRKAISEFGLSPHHRREFCRKVTANLLFESRFSTI